MADRPARRGRRRGAGRAARRTRHDGRGAEECGRCSTPSPTPCRAACPRSPPTRRRRPRRGGGRGPGDRLRRPRSRTGLARHRSVGDRPAPAGAIALRVEADEEELVAGAVRLVLQVHDERDPLHVCDAALLWTETGPREPRVRRRARTHATSRCARPPRPGRCSTGCSSCGFPTRSRSTPTSSSACSTTASRRCGSAASTCSGRASWAATSRCATVLDRSPGAARG